MSSDRLNAYGEALAKQLLHIYIITVVSWAILAEVKKKMEKKKLYHLNWQCRYKNPEIIRLKQCHGENF